MYRIPTVPSMKSLKSMESSVESIDNFVKSPSFESPTTESAVKSPEGNQIMVLAFMCTTFDTRLIFPPRIKLLQDALF